MSIRKTAEDVEVTNRENIFQAYFQMTRYHFKHRKFAGGWSEEISREVFQRGAVSAVLPYDAKRDRLVLIEQFRAGAWAAMEKGVIYAKESSTPWLIEIVAGVIEEGEPPEEVAKRELQEEANCTALEIDHVMDLHLSAGAVNEPLSLFCANVDSCSVAGIHGLDEEGEDIRVFTATPQEAADLLTEGKVHSAIAIIALQWFAAHHEELRQRWS